MAAEAGLNLGQAVTLLGAGVGAALLFRRLGLGSVLGYLGAGLLIGPSVLGLFDEPETILHVAELGVVMLLFLIGLEMRPAKLWALRRELFGLGLTQVVLCIALLTGLGVAAGLAWPVALIGASGFVLSSTAVITKTLEERGELNSPSGQRSVSILLMEDLAIVPLLALVAVLASITGAREAAAEAPLWRSALVATAAIGLVLVAGRWLINPLFRALATSGGREVMTAAALLVVLGSAWAMQSAGLSMAMGAFLAGVLLSDSAFRHQLEADIEPFRGLLLGLFFLSVGMSLDLATVAEEWRLILIGVPAYMLVKAGGILVTARLFGASGRESVQRAAMFAQGGEFAFVLYAAAAATGVFEARIADVFTAMVILSMAVTPLALLALERLIPAPKPSMDGVEEADGLTGSVLFVGFGRFAQVVSQPLLTRGVDISLIETDVEMIQAAAQFGFKVYYGDGTRLDVLRASGAGTARAIFVCVDKPETADRIVELVKAEFPQALLMVRAFDRGHAIRLIQADVDFQIRETFESAMAFGREALIRLGVAEDEADETLADVRRRDEERLSLQVVSGIQAGRSLMRGNLATPEPAPLVKPRREGKVIGQAPAPEADASAGPGG